MHLPCAKSRCVPAAARDALWLLGRALVAVAPLALCGCGTGFTRSPYAQLRVIDASTNTAGVDIYAGATPLSYNIGFGSVVAYTPVATGNYMLSAKEAGSKTAVSAISGSFASGTSYTLLLSNASAGTQSQLLMDSSVPAPGAQSLLRIIDQAAQLGPVDVYLLPLGGTLSTTRPVATAVTANAIRPGISVPSGTYQVVVLAAGTVPVSTGSTTAATVPLYTGTATIFPAGSNRTLVLLDTQITRSPLVNAVVLSDSDSLAP